VHPGITSAVGLLSTDLKYDLIKNEFMLDSATDLVALNSDFAALDEEARAQLSRDGISEDDMEIAHFADCRYVGQGYELRVPFPQGSLDEGKLAAFWDNFHRLHQEEYGHSFPGNPIELVNIRVVATGAMPKIPSFRAPTSGSLDEATYGEVPVYFPGDAGLKQTDTRLYDRARLPAGTRVNGPAIVIELDSTVVVPPGSTAEVLQSGEILIRV
jgi:N-methylhydantoinase A